MLKLTRKNESGRSMIEMLGVLAVIGVLSVGGIAGYTTAMNSHYANQAADQARRLAAVASAKRLINPSAHLIAEELGGNFTMDETETGFIKLTVTGLSEAVKNRIKDMDLGIAKVDDGEAEGSLVFTFKNDLSEIDANGSQQGMFDQNDSGKCAPGYYPQGECNQQCAGNTKVNAAQNGCECKDDYVLKDGDCIACPEGSGTNSSYKGEELGSYGYSGCTCIHEQDYYSVSSGQCVSVYTCENDGDTCESSEYWSEISENGSFEGVCYKGRCCAGTDYAYDFFNITEIGPCCELAGGTIEYEYECCNEHGFNMSTQAFTSTCCEAVHGSFYQAGASVGGYEAGGDVCCVNYDDLWGSDSEFCQATNPNP